MKVKFKDKLKDYKKGTVSNLLAVAGVYALDLVITMININAAHNNNTNTALTDTILNWSAVTYILCFVLIGVSYFGIQRQAFKRVRRVMLFLIVITVLNLATFVYAGLTHSLMLIVPVLMLIYMQEKTKEFIK